MAESVGSKRRKPRKRRCEHGSSLRHRSRVWHRHTRSTPRSRRRSGPTGRKSASDGGAGGGSRHQLRRTRGLARHCQPAHRNRHFQLWLYDAHTGPAKPRGLRISTRARCEQFGQDLDVERPSHRRCMTRNISAAAARRKGMTLLMP